MALFSDSFTTHYTYEEDITYNTTMYMSCTCRVCPKSGNIYVANWSLERICLIHFVIACLSGVSCAYYAIFFAVLFRTSLDYVTQPYSKSWYVHMSI